MECHVEIGKQSAAKAVYESAPLQPFDVLRFSIMPRLNYWMDGSPGKRTLFIADDEETVVISFEEGMHCLDLTNRGAGHSVEYRHGLRYLHQTRAMNARDCIFFHMEIADQAGVIHYLPGQMLIRAGQPWEQGVEPILIEVLNSIMIAGAETTDCA